ncbi:transcription factor BIM2-like [Miscanthus floridulus]|uniref:transcription factor BIM2-like n=1 Tax=Miscanthus floridulus TaxID=154761 RepID=UPI00345B39B3
MQLFQGEKPAHDFLSLHTGGGSSSPVQHSSQAAGYELGVHSSLKPLKLGRRRGGGEGDGAIGVAPSSGLEADSEERVLPGGVGTFSIRQVASATPSRGEAASHGVVVRGAAFPPAVQVSRTEGPPQGTESGARAHSGPATMWQDSGMDQTSRGARGGEGRSRSSGSSADQGPSTPRSKHSATEQRRRTKINDRLEVLRELLPHGDQKRDKASFLLEVIEYIRFLQEKVQKYESAHPQKNHEDSSMPWAKVYYRSCWKNTENINQGGGLAASTQDTNKEQYGSKQTTVASSALFDAQSAREASANDICSQKPTSTAQSRADNNIPSKQPPWLSMSTSDSDNRTLSKNEKQTLHEDTQSLSDAYSQGLLNRLTQALKRSGVDPSQASISVEIRMDRRATEPNNIHDDLKDHECEDTIHVTKKLRCERS